MEHTLSNNPDNKKKEKTALTGFEEWGGYMAAKKQKLMKQFKNQKAAELSREEATSKIFSGISIYVNGYTNPTADELKRLMMLHGGDYHHYYSLKKTTHMIATNLPHGKMKSLKNQKVVIPDWITDSITAGKILPYQRYLLYTPEMTFNQNRLQLKPESNNLDTIQRAPEIADNFFHEVGNTLVDSLGPSPSSSMDLLLPHMELSAVSVVPKSKSPTPSYNDKTMNSTVSTKTEMLEDMNINNIASTFTTMQNDKKKNTVENMCNKNAIKAGNLNFISEFYNHSRLHHLSTSAQDLKEYVQQLAAQHKGKPFPGREMLIFSKKPLNLPPLTKQEKMIMHLDMDCFFVSVGLRKCPELRNQPVAVAHSKGKHVKRGDGSNLKYEAHQYKQRLKVLPLSDDDQPNETSYSDFGSMSEIACCNYLARESGLWNGMYLGEALRLCPGLKIIPYDFDAYSEVTKMLYDIVTSFTLDIEAVSCDEMYIDCTELISTTKVSATDFADHLRYEIYVKTECTASAGIGNNMLLARLASRRAKPNGQFIVKDVGEFMQDQMIKDLPGVGYATRPKLEQLGVRTCSDLQKWPIAKLQNEFGDKKGQMLYEHCRGTDIRVVTMQKVRKSISAEMNYGIRFEEEKEIYNFLNGLAGEVHKRLNTNSKKGRSITLKLLVRRDDAPRETAKFMGHGVCDSVSKSSLLKTATNDAEIIAKEVCNMARSLKVPPQDYRGVGIQVTKLESVPAGSKSEQTLDNFLSKRGCSSHEIPKKLVQFDRNGLQVPPENLHQEVFSLYSVKSNVPAKQESSPQANKQQVLPKTTQSKLPKPSHSSITLYCRKNEISQKTDLFSSPLSLKVSDEASSKANLGGAIQIDEVRDLIKEWVTSTKSPAEEDVEQFKNYILKLIDEDLEKVDLILKYVHRLASNATELWRQAYLLSLSYVQQKMLQNFGHMLKARNHFSPTS